MPPPPPRPLQPHRRLLALDPGERRIGVAVSDELGLYAHPRPAILVTPRVNVVEAIARLVEDEQVAEVVVGLPLSMSGLESAQTATAHAFANRLRERLGVPVTEWDERLSSVEAERQLKGPRRRTGELDSAAASLVLQAVLDSRRRGVRFG